MYSESDRVRAVVEQTLDVHDLGCRQVLSLALTVRAPGCHLDVLPVLDRDPVLPEDPTEDLLSWVFCLASYNVCLNP